MRPMPPTAAEALDAGFALPGALRGEPGAHLAEWLAHEGVPAVLAADAAVAFRDHVDSHRATAELAAMRSDLESLAFARRYDAAPAFLAYLRQALRRVDTLAALDGFLAHLAWLADVMAARAGAGALEA